MIYLYLSIFRKAFDTKHYAPLLFIIVLYILTYRLVK